MAVICQLRRRGFSLQRMRKVIRFLQQEFGTSLAATVGASLSALRRSITCSPMALIFICEPRPDKWWT